jgi:hypothetical protein
MPGSTAGSDRASATEVAGVETPGVSGVEALSRAQRYLPQRPDDEVQLRTRIIELISQGRWIEWAEFQNVGLG